jgi:hypothetical protein
MLRRVKRTWALAVSGLLALLTACGDDDAAGDGPEVFEGLYTSGFEVSSFVACGRNEVPGSGVGSWLESRTADFHEVFNAAATTAGPQGRRTAYVRFEGRLNLPERAGQGFGHAGAYKTQVVVTRLLEVSRVSKCPAAP